MQELMNQEVITQIILDIMAIEKRWGVKINVGKIFIDNELLPTVKHENP